jgi:ubiquinone/menaquinone biosynthesis C-methylase UbiE
MKYYFFLLLYLLTTNLIAQDPWKDIYRESAWEQRDTWQRAADIISNLKLTSASKVADVGCHEGYFTIKLAGVVKSGKVYAVDISKSKVEKLQEHLAERDIRNVEVILGREDNPTLPENTLDAVLIVDTYHEMDHHASILRHIKNALKPGGRLLLCEPISDERQALGRDDQERKHELGMSFAVEDLKNAGFKITFRQEAFIDRVKEKGDKMWIIVCEKSN